MILKLLVSLGSTNCLQGWGEGSDTDPADHAVAGIGGERFHLPLLLLVSGQELCGLYRYLCKAPQELEKKKTK